MMKRCFLVGLMALAVGLTACNNKQKADAESAQQPGEGESRQAKALLQGIWVDAETGEVSFRAEGDTIFYPDSTSQPAYFKIVDGSLVLGSQRAKYPIEKQSANVFWFRNQNGDVVKLNKSDDPDDTADFQHDNKPKVMTYTEVVKRDSVVTYGGERYHWYIAINPTRYREEKKSYNDDGMEVENVYYDNIIHVSVFKGAQRLYSSNFKKQMFSSDVPGNFLEQAILSNMEYDHIDASGLHFNATLCIPDGALCYMVATSISYGGQMTMKLLEY